MAAIQERNEQQIAKYAEKAKKRKAVTNIAKELPAKRHRRPSKVLNPTNYHKFCRYLFEF